MRKFAISFLVVLGIILVLWIAGRITGVVQFYNISSAANEPALKQGEKIFTSNLGKPAAYKFITFKSPYHDSVFSSFQENYNQGASYVYRICGMPGDVVQMNNGVLFVNNKNFDDPLNLYNQYKVSNKEFALIDESDLQPEAGNVFFQSTDSAVVTFDDVLYKKYAASIKLVPFLSNDTSASAGCFKWYSDTLNWTVDNFGPLKVPEGNYFLLGDNRHNAMDSRYTGFIKKKYITGVVLNK